ncbi:MAG: hypothetical protein GY851_32415 [bacterium]|nr:hypothetical protein [bacterium]
MEDHDEGMKKRHCYCDLWEKKPEVLEQQGVPRGYCGFCNVCGEPGHTRHFPGAVPYTGSWCDRHYRYLLLFHTASLIGCCAWLTILAGVGFLTWKFVS